MLNVWPILLETSGCGINKEITQIELGHQKLNFFHLKSPKYPIVYCFSALIWLETHISHLKSPLFTNSSQ